MPDVDETLILTLSLILNVLLIAGGLGSRKGRQIGERIEQVSQKLREDTAYLRGWLKEGNNDPF